MLGKMKTTLWVEGRIKIAPPDYSKENYLATFTPQKQLNPEHIFWFNDILKERAKALKEEAKAPKPIPALMVYLPNTPAKLVPMVLPTKSQVKINIFVLIQLFSEFDKTCKKRITPTDLAGGDRGFEQTKEFYLTETTTSLLNEIENLKAQIKGKMQCVTIDNVKPKVLARGICAIDVDPIPPRHRNNRAVHLEYLKHLKESVETVREIVKEAKIKNTLDNELESACLHTKRSQELLEYVIGTCPKEFSKRDKKVNGWAMYHSINDASKGGLKSYALYVMVIYHFQATKPSILPPLSELYTRKVMQKIEDGDKRWKDIFAENVTSSRGSENKQGISELFYLFLSLHRKDRGTIWRGAGNLAKSIQEDVQLQRIEGVFKKIYKEIMRERLANIVKNLVIEDLIEVVSERERDTIAMPSVVGQKADVIDFQDQPNM
nr:hypothetical protein [Tanacetum cinerariifolium]